MDEKKIVCTVCPVGCETIVSGDSKKAFSVKGNSCKRGEAFVKDEYELPLRILTSTISVLNGSEVLIPVRSDKKIPRNMIMECMAQIKVLKTQAPIKEYDILIKNILGTDINIIACSSCKKVS